MISAVTAAVMILFAKGKIPKDVSWNAAKKFMGSVDGFLTNLVNFDKDNVKEECVAEVESKYLTMPKFTVADIEKKSGAAAGLCS